VECQTALKVSQKCGTFSIWGIFIIKHFTMAKFVITQKQLDFLVENLKNKTITEDADGSYMAKQQLFVIATMAYKMWEMLDDNAQLEDWMESKIAQCEQSVSSVVKAYLYDEFDAELKGMDTLNYDDLVIGK
jgi:hypothetical protein